MRAVTALLCAGSVMQLLSQLYIHGAQHAADTMPLASLVPRLWPCFWHTLIGVRLASVRCLAALLPSSRGISSAQSPTWLAGEHFLTAMRLLFHNLVLEAHAGLLQASQQLWSQLLQAAPSWQLATLPRSCLDVSNPDPMSGKLVQMCKVAKSMQGYPYA